MKPTSVSKDTRHKLDQPLKKLAYVSNHWGPLLYDAAILRRLLVVTYIWTGQRWSYLAVVIDLFARKSSVGQCLTHQIAH